MSDWGTCMEARDPELGSSDGADSETSEQRDHVVRPVRPAGCLAGWLVGWLAGCLAGPPAGGLPGWRGWPPPQIRSCWPMVLDNWFIRKYYTLLNTF